MIKKLVMFASSLFLAMLAFAPTPRAMIFTPAPGATIGRLAHPASSPVPDSLHRSLYPANVVCKDFDKTGYKTWQLRDRSTVDLGNWSGALQITGAIKPGAFVRNGVDLFDVLEIRCGLEAHR